MTASVGSELWRSDGTGKGTKLTQEHAYPGGDGLFPRHVRGLTGASSFGAADDENGYEALQDRWHGPRHQARKGHRGWSWRVPRAFVRRESLSASTSCFQADNGNDGQELWRTDGSKQGTKQLKDINVAPDGSAPLDGAQFTGSRRAGPVLASLAPP